MKLSVPIASTFKNPWDVLWEKIFEKLRVLSFYSKTKASVGN